MNKELKLPWEDPNGVALPFVMAHMFHAIRIVFYKIKKLKPINDFQPRFMLQVEVAKRGRMTKQSHLVTGFITLMLPTSTMSARELIMTIRQAIMAFGSYVLSISGNGGNPKVNRRLKDLRFYWKMIVGGIEQQLKMTCYLTTATEYCSLVSAKRAMNGCRSYGTVWNEGVPVCYQKRTSKDKDMEFVNIIWKGKGRFPNGKGQKYFWSFELETHRIIHDVLPLWLSKLV